MRHTFFCYLTDKITRCSDSEQPVISNCNVVFERFFRANLEGGYHRSPMSKEELKLVFERPFTSEEIGYFNKTTIETVRKLLENSINHSNATLS